MGRTPGFPVLSVADEPQVVSGLAVLADFLGEMLQTSLGDSARGLAVCADLAFARGKVLKVDG